MLTVMLMLVLMLMAIVFLLYGSTDCAWCDKAEERKQLCTWAILMRAQYSVFANRTKNANSSAARKLNKQERAEARLMT
jgi:hypothetical protein